MMLFWTYWVKYKISFTCFSLLFNVTTRKFQVVYAACLWACFLFLLASAFPNLSSAPGSCCSVKYLEQRAVLNEIVL